MPVSITYGESSDPVFVNYYDTQLGMSTVYLSFYDWKIIKVQESNFDFFNFVLTGHRTLWLPYDVGSTIVGCSVLLYAITLITDIILWWPKRWNKKAIRRNFTIK